MVHKKEEGTYHHTETLMKEMPGFLSPWERLLSPINKEQRIPDRSKTVHRKPPVKCFLTLITFCMCNVVSRATTKEQYKEIYSKTLQILIYFGY